MQLKNWLQNTVAKWFLPDFSFKGGSALDCRALLIFHFNVDQNSVAEHYEIDFDMIFRLNAAQNLVVKHYIIEFYMIFHFINAAQNLVAEHYERDFDLIFRLKAEQKLFVEQCEWDFFTWFFTLRKLNTWLQRQHAEHYERFWHDFLLYGGTERGCRVLWKTMGDQE